MRFPFFLLPLISLLACDEATPLDATLPVDSPTPDSVFSVCDQFAPSVSEVEVSNASDDSAPALRFEALVDDEDGDLFPSISVFVFWDAVIDGQIGEAGSEAFGFQVNAPSGALCETPTLQVDRRLTLSMIDAGTPGLPRGTLVEMQLTVIDYIGDSTEMFEGHVGLSEVLTVCVPNEDGTDGDC